MIVPTPTGLDFDGWQFAAHSLTIEELVGDPRLDRLSDPDTNYICLEIESAGLANEPGGSDNLQHRIDFIRSCKGLGYWRTPNVVILIDHIQNPFDERANCYWEVPKYKRRRPFSESKQQRQFLHRLIEKCEIERPYVTSIDKIWYPKYISEQIFEEELKLLETNGAKLILHLGKLELPKTKIRVVRYPLPEAAFTTWKAQWQWWYRGANEKVRSNSAVPSGEGAARISGDVQ